ncbi:ParB N-terminal domain-containing protein [Streptomyces sp. NPDC008150]|uniref:ParB N-terminal domain-containing protein n=1 Tax=Streptomyces sp. NPDC008150 TaxID=3364816 RepID=UPI0036E489D1
MTDPTETARALLYRYGLPEDVIDGALCLHAQELAAGQAGLRSAVLREADQRPLTLATPCVVCKHPYNWHTAEGCQVEICGCIAFAVPAKPTAAVSQPVPSLVHVGWWCWRGTGEGHLAATACRSDNVPLHVPAEWAADMRAMLARLEDDDEHAAGAQPVPADRAALRDRVEVWPLARLLAEVRCGSEDWSWEEEWADLDRRHAGDGYLETLERQIRARGITTPVLVGSDGRLWDGHHRLRIAVRVGIGYVPVELPGTTTTDETEAYRLALSQALGLGTGANWEAIRDRAEDLVAEELAQVRGHAAVPSDAAVSGVLAALPGAAGMAQAAQQAEAAEEKPLTPEQIVREHVTTLHLLGEQLAGVESWMWQHLGAIRAASSSAPTEEAQA